MKKYYLFSCVLILILTACSSKPQETLVTTYENIYTTDINTLDYLLTDRTSDGQHFANFVEGLYENDASGKLVPDLAQSHTVSKDGLVYTFNIKEGIKWMTHSGEHYADVKAQDWVTALEHAVKVNSKTLYIVENSIKGLKEYINNPSLGFDTVGIKAKNDTELEYTLNKPEPYFLSKTTYGILFPVNSEFLKSKGANFGTALPDSILYNGPFILESHAAKSSITYIKNDNYWDKDKVYINNIKLTYNDGSNPTDLIKMYEKGTLTSSRVYPSAPDYPSTKEKHGDTIILSESGGVTYYMPFNINREAKRHSAKTEAKQFEDTKASLLNRDFRLAIAHAIDRSSLRAQSVGNDLKNSGLRNNLVPPTFVAIEGSDYGKEVLDAMKKLDAEAWEHFKIDDYQDGFFNSDQAKKFFDKAKSALSAKNVTYPIHIDVPVEEKREIAINIAKSLKASIETTLGSNNVVIDINLLNADDYDNATYFAETGAQSDYDISLSPGWGPDYTDPSTYLDIFNSEYGASIASLGLIASQDSDNASSAAVVDALKLKDYDKLLSTADAITDNLNERYKAYAKANAWLNNQMLIVPFYSDGATPHVTKVVPFSGPYSWTGLSSYKFKGTKIHNQSITIPEKEKRKKDWEKSKQ